MLAGRATLREGQSSNRMTPTFRYSLLVRYFSVIIKTVPTLLQACLQTGIL